MERKTLQTAVAAEPTETIECPVCDETIRAVELAAEHAHTDELLELVLDLLPATPDGEHRRKGDRETASRDPWKTEEGADESLDRANESETSSTDTSDSGDGGCIRETIIRYDPDGRASQAMSERLRAYTAGASSETIAALPERRVFGVGTEADYERLSEAVWGVANAFVGSAVHAGHELVACPECHYEGSVDQAVFPGGTAHRADGETDDE